MRSWMFYNLIILVICILFMFRWIQKIILTNSKHLFIKIKHKKAVYKYVYLSIYTIILALVYYLCVKNNLNTIFL